MYRVAHKKRYGRFWRPFYNCPNSFVCIVMMNSVFKKMMPRLYIFSSSFYTYWVAQKKKTHCRFNQFCTCIEIMSSVSKKMMARLYISLSNLYMYRVAQKKDTLSILDAFSLQNHQIKNITRSNCMNLVPFFSGIGPWIYRTSFFWPCGIITLLNY